MKKMRLTEAKVIGIFNEKSQQDQKISEGCRPALAGYQDSQYAPGSVIENR